MELENNNQILTQRNNQIEATLKQQEDMGALTEETVTEIIKVPDPYSEKIVHLVAKHNALEDCMAAVKKGFEKDAVSITDFLKQVR